MKEMKRVLLAVSIAAAIAVSTASNASPSGLELIPEFDKGLCTDLLGSRQALSNSGVVGAWVRECLIKKDPSSAVSEKIKIPSAVLVRNLACKSPERDLYATVGWDDRNPESPRNDPREKGGGLRSAAVSANGKVIAWVADWPTFGTSETGPGAVWYKVAHVFVAELADNLCESIAANMAAVKLGTIRRADQGLAGLPTNGAAAAPFLSADGRYLVFESRASNLDSDGWSERRDGVNRIYLFDRLLSKVFSITPNADGDSTNPSVSDDGNLVAFASRAKNLVPKDENDAQDIFVYDRAGKKMRRININTLVSPPVEADQTSDDSQISGDGNWVVFSSVATNLTARVLAVDDEDPQPIQNVFVTQLSTGKTYLVNGNEQVQCKDGWDTIANTGGWGGKPWGICRGRSSDEPSWGPSISHDGRYIGFSSMQSDLIAGWPWTAQGDIGGVMYYVRDMVLERFFARSVRYAEASGVGTWRGLNRPVRSALSSDGSVSAHQVERRYECTDGQFDATGMPNFRQLCFFSGPGIRDTASPKP